MKTAIASLLVALGTIAPSAYAGPLCNGLADRAVEAANPPFPFECECGLRLVRRLRFNCEAEVCLSGIDGAFSGVLPVELPILYDESTCLNPTFKGRIPKRFNGDIEVGGCTGAATMVVDAEALVKQVTGDQNAQASQAGLPSKLNFEIPNSCLDATTSSRPGLRDRSINLSGCTASIGGEACPCTICGAGSGIEIGADCINKLFNSMIPSEVTDSSNQDVKDAFTFTADPICISADNLFTGRGVADVMLTPYLSQV